jgi:hypothetical protein
LESRSVSASSIDGEGERDIAAAIAGNPSSAL